MKILLQIVPWWRKQSNCVFQKICSTIKLGSCYNLVYIWHAQWRGILEWNCFRKVWIERQILQDNEVCWIFLRLCQPHRAHTMIIIVLWSIGRDLVTQSQDFPKTKTKSGIYSGLFFFQSYIKLTVMNNEQNRFKLQRNYVLTLCNFFSVYWALFCCPISILSLLHFKLFFVLISVQRGGLAV